MKALEALKQDADLSRVYRTQTTMCDDVLWHVSDMTTRIPGIDWAGCCKFPKGPPKREPYDIEVKHMIHWGRADARIIEDAFKVTLPAYVHELYSEIRECVLNWKYSYHILDPKSVVEWERFHREEEGADSLPVHFIRFCKVSGSSGSIALRKQTQTGKWHVDYASLYETTEEAQSSKYDDTHLSEDLDGWIQRLMANDGILHDDDRNITAVERVA